MALYMKSLTPPQDRGHTLQENSDLPDRVWREVRQGRDFSHRVQKFRGGD